VERAYWDSVAEEYGKDWLDPDADEEEFPEENWSKVMEEMETLLVSDRARDGSVDSGEDVETKADIERQLREVQCRSLRCSSVDNGEEIGGNHQARVRGSTFDKARFS
jgi:hypothetical protein